MSEVGARALCLLVGYALGNFMTAEVVTRALTGKPCRDLGKTGNPGMANVMANLGFVPGILVLIGDLAKCGLACLFAWLIAGPSIGHIAVLYGGVGATLGHDFPVWLPPGKGGKGVATSCFAMFLFSPLWGLVANVIGMLVTFATKYLCIGGAVLPASFVPFAFLFYGREAGVISILVAVLCFWKHWPAIRTIPAGTCEKTDVLAALQKFVASKRKSEK